MQLSSSSTKSRDLLSQSRDQLYPISWGTAGHVTGEEGHVTSLTSWGAACDISARSFGLPTNYERPIVGCLSNMIERFFKQFKRRLPEIVAKSKHKMANFIVVVLQ